MPQFGYLLLHTYDLKKVFYGLGSGLRQSLNWSDFKYLPCPIPPIPEQTAIVRYLDYVERRVRQFVRAKQKLIGLLEEQKQVIVHRAVTRGLDPDVPLKSSGVQVAGGGAGALGWCRKLKILSSIECINGAWGSASNWI